MEIKPKKWWESSVEANKVALRIKGGIVVASSAIFLITGYFGLEVVQADVNALANIISNMVAYGGLFIGAVLHFWGWVRKIKK